MSRSALAVTLIALTAAAAALEPAAGADSNKVPALSANAWDGDGENEFTPPKSGPGPTGRRQIVPRPCLATHLR